MLVPILLLELGAGNKIAGLSGYIGLCILLGPATLASESLRYMPQSRGLSLREKVVDYVDRWFRTRPGEKFNVLVLSGAIAAVIAVLKSIFPALSITGFIVRGPWIPMLNGEIHPDFLGDTLMFLTLFVLIVKGVRRVGARRPARSGPQEDHTGLGGAVAVRPQGCSQAARLPMVRRKRWPATIMVHLGNEIALLKTEIYLSEVEPRLQTLTALSRFSVRA